MNIEEGDICPECTRGIMEYPEVENCSCHITPPCSACTGLKLTCDDCGMDEDEIHEAQRNRDKCIGKNL